MTDVMVAVLLCAAVIVAPLAWLTVKGSVAFSVTWQALDPGEALVTWPV